MDNRQKIQNSIDYIETHLDEELSLEDIARQSYLSKYHFHRIFRQVIGTSVMDYIRKRRLSDAAVELAETDEQITDIAFKHQFSSEESFSRAFKKLYGTSPRNYRNREAKTCRIKANKLINISTTNTLLNRAA